MADTANITANISDTASITGNSVSSATITSSVTTSTSVTGSVTTGGVGADGTDATGDVVGPASSTDTAIARFDSTTGKLLKNSATTIADNGYIYSPGSLETAGAIIADTISEHTASAGITHNTDKLIISTAKTPANASAAGTAGTIAWDTSYIYICTATNTWKRVAIATW